MGCEHSAYGRARSNSGHLSVCYNRSWALPGQALAHGGDIFGEDTQVWVAPALNFIVVIYANCSSTNPNTGLALNDAATVLVLRYSAVTAAGPLLETPSALPLRNLDGGFAFDYLTLPGVPYAVETSTDLKIWNPTNGAYGQTATSLQSTFTDNSPGIKKFYRAKTWQ